MKMHLEAPTHELEFRCIGIIKAIYKPLDEEQFYKGHLCTSRSDFGATILNQSLLTYLKSNQDKLDEAQYWTVFMRNHPRISFQIKHLRNNIDNEEWEDEIYSIRGVIKFIDYQKNSVQVIIKRNKPYNPDDKKTIPFVVAVTLPRDTVPPENMAAGQFWDFVATRRGQKMIVQESTFIQEYEDFRELLRTIPRPPRMQSNSYSERRDDYAPRRPAPSIPKVQDRRQMNQS